MARFLPLLLLAAGCGQMGMSELVDEDADTWLSFDPDGEISFGKVSPSGKSVEQQVTLSAQGEAPVTVSDLWIECETKDVFYLDGELPFPRVMDPGDTIPVDLRFMPKTAGGFRGTLVVELADGRVMERNLTGSGCSDSDHDGVCSK